MSAESNESGPRGKTDLEALFGTRGILNRIAAPPVCDVFPRALTNFDPEEEDPAIYRRAAEETCFPVWIEQFPIPEGPGDFPPADTDVPGVEFRPIIVDSADGSGRPSRSGKVWSLWTEWGRTDHGPFWRRVRELDAISRSRSP